MPQSSDSDGKPPIDTDTLMKNFVSYIAEGAEFQKLVNDALQCSLQHGFVAIWTDGDGKTSVLEPDQLFITTEPQSPE